VREAMVAHTPRWKRASRSIDDGSDSLKRVPRGFEADHPLAEDLKRITTEHDTGHGHPECPDRLRSVMAGLEISEFKGLERLEAPIIDLKEIELNHQGSYVKEVFDNMPLEGRVYLDPDTSMSPASGEASRRAAGAVCDAIDKVMSGQADNAFCAVRPPGHHAESNRAMGFCLFNSIAIGAMYARTGHGLGRVAVVDFDVHHGNGTQHSFERDSGLFYASSHQWPAYPGTGAQDETGEFGNICNFLQTSTK